jgi:hypothetical protein
MRFIKAVVVVTSDGSCSAAPDDAGVGAATVFPHAQERCRFRTKQSQADASQPQSAYLETTGSLYTYSHRTEGK